MSSLPPPVPELPADLVTGATVLPNRHAILPLIPADSVICEVGVGLGGFSRAIIDCCAPARFIAIDDFRLHELPEFWGHSPGHWFGEQTHGAWYRDEFATDIASGRVTVIEAPSHLGLEQLPDSSVDVIYVDADHTYDAVVRDLAAASRKLTESGYLWLNDYILVDHLRAEHPYGVIYAANEFMLAGRWIMQYFALQPNMYCDVVLRRAGSWRPETGDAALLRIIGSLRQENERLRRRGQA